MVSSFICLLLFGLSSLISGAAYAQENFCFWDLRQDAFIKDELSYLNVARAGTYTEHNIFDCTFECNSNPSCQSLNIAASKGADGKLWCDLLASTKYSSPDEHKANASSHHISIKTPRLSSCKNGGTCVPTCKHRTFQFKCREGFIEKYCEIAGNTCKDLYDVYKSNVNEMVTIYLDSKPVSLLCHIGNFGCEDGSWTPVMKIDGSKSTFHYDSSLWGNKESFHLAGGETGFDGQETKLPTYWNTSFSKICLGMKIGEQINFIVMNKPASSLFSLIADGQHRATSLGRYTWKTLIGDQASLQSECNREGFIAKADDERNAKARIGYLANNENDCGTCDSRIGFGTGGDHDDSNTCGNEATLGGDNGGKHIKALGYILVQ